MRKQYHFRKVNDDIYIWDVHHLIKLSQNFQTKQVKLYQIKELDEAYWFDDVHPTTRQIIEHIKLIQDADLSYPIILSADGRVMDGMHRVAKAVLLSLEHIGAVQFKETPPPDFINVDENELDYD
ncbi:hypothetical protein [Acinetobacter stercoris]|uniref:Chromosome partitioning protein ParB n=1 Tax=Acinetobacter stercoris TaxID=2126983 RepID=A0A2U3MV19_9GAMM|nr:hypothetical protein [Acinetobacter stercoris]SPL69266.1 hypothetical protein KPC_0444 [Acinetobacter stercoris]